MIRRALPSGTDLTVDLGALRLPNPVVAASGTFGHGDELAALCDPRGVGAVTTKSVAIFASEGNPALRVAEAPGGGMINSVGLPGPGIDAWIEHDLPALEARGARIVASIWGRTVADFERAARSLKEVADRIVAVEANLSCPNVEARAHVFAHDPEAHARRDPRGRRRPGWRGTGVREAVAECHRSRRDRGRRTRRGRERSHVGQHGDGSRDRRRVPGPAARSGRWRSVGSAHQADRAARGVGGGTRDSPASRSSGPGE